MKLLVTLDEAFSNDGISEFSEALKQMEDQGIQDPEFLKTSRKYLTSIASLENLLELEFQRREMHE